MLPTTNFANEIISYKNLYLVPISKGITFSRKLSSLLAFPERSSSVAEVEGVVQIGVLAPEVVQPLAEN